MGTSLFNPQQVHIRYYDICKRYLHWRLSTKNGKKIKHWIGMNEILKDGIVFETEKKKRISPKPSWKNPISGMTMKFDVCEFFDGRELINRAISKMPEEACRIVPDEQIPNLMERLRGSNMDNSHYRNRGRVGWMVTRLNELPHKQPKRITMSAVLETKTTGPAHGNEIFKMLLYNSNNGIPLEDWRCRPMDREVYELGKYLWQKLHGILSTISKVCPPNSCQVNFYYAALGGDIKKHRDYGIGGGSGRNKVDKEDCQIVGTNVMSFTYGSPMLFSQYTNHKTTGGGKYRTSERHTTTVEEGSCLVLHPDDDKNMLHGAKFAGENNNAVRVVFNYRWCQNAKWFYGNEHPMRSLRCAVANHLEIPDMSIRWKFLLEGRERNYNREDWDREIKSRGYKMHNYYED